MKNFSNQIVLPDNLPVVEQQSFNPLDKKYLRMLFIQMGVFFFFIIGGFVTFLAFTDENIPPVAIIMIAAVLALLILYFALITFLGFPRKGYLLRENDISFHKGLLKYKVTSVPFNRIQHVEVNRGVLAKVFGLSTVKLFTAGGNASDLSIPGLPAEVAQKLKTFLSEKISEHE